MVKRQEDSIVSCLPIHQSSSLFLCHVGASGTHKSFNLSAVGNKAQEGREILSLSAVTRGTLNTQPVDEKNVLSALWHILAMPRLLPFILRVLVGAV